MPNWCNNNLQIVVEFPTQLEVVIQAITNDSEQPFDFNRIIPIPEELQETTAPNKHNPDELKAKYGFADWYEWRVFNWGTKWNASDVELEIHSPTNMTIRFNTAWSPPEPIIKKIASMFPFASLTLEWEEEGGYYGSSQYENGIMLYEESAEMDCAYRWKTWGDCYEGCNECGECDCEVCNCPYRAQQTICESCNQGNHTEEERKDDEESESEKSALSTTEESD